jgi:hypothetical protein
MPPLALHPTNPRTFTKGGNPDEAGIPKPVYLTGSRILDERNS